MSKSLEIINKMNEWGKLKKPFLFIIDFNMENPQIVDLAEVDQSKILFQIGAQKNFSENGYSKKQLSFEKYPPSYKDYKNAFDVVYSHIYAGNTYLTNLTLPTRIETNYSLHEIFFHSNARYKLIYDNQFVCFSPETFIQIKDGFIFSFPMKGTIDAAIPNAEQIILHDEKETAEHVTIIDLIRNDLSIVAKDVVVEKSRYVERIKTHEKELLQVSSKIKGKLSEDYSETIGDIIFNLLPAGSISGAPKKKTVQIIKKAEKYERGFYTGVFGIFDGTNLDSAVMIRFIERIGNELFFKSGGGITFLSDPLKEYQELIDKVYVPII